MGWEQCSHGLTSEPLKTSHHQCLKAVCGVLGYPAGAAAELLDGTTSFTTRFGEWAGKRDCVASSRLLDDGGNVTERVGLTRKTCPGTPVHFRPDPALPTPKRWKRLHPPDASGAGERWACLATFFLALGLVDHAGGYAWNLLP